MTTPHEYARTHAERFRAQLHDLIRIPSVSTTPEHAADVRRAADWLVDDLKRIGFQNAESVPTPGHPVVVGEWLGAGANAPTVLIYGHYDVQPAAMADGWTSDPFEPVERDGKIYARGSTDDKGQMFAQLKAAESVIQTGAALVNIKVIFEGEEEISSVHIADFIKGNRERLRADVCVISDSGLLNRDQPSIVYSLRGLIYTELHVTAAEVDLHSGMFGGTVHNPAQALCEIIAQLHNPDGSVNVPGFYDDVLPLSPEERAELAKTNWTEAQWREASRAIAPWGEPDYAISERIGARPTLEVNGMLSGFTGDGAKTVLPAKAMAKVSCRLVANQQPMRIFELLRDHIQKITPPTVKSELRYLADGDGAFVDINTPAMQAAVRAYEHVFGVRPVFVRSGGTLPVVADFQRELNLPVLLMGFGLDTDGAHGPNEHFEIDLFHKGIDTAIHFLQEAGTLLAK